MRRHQLAHQDVHRPARATARVRRHDRTRRLRPRVGHRTDPDTQHFVFGRRSFFGYLVRADGDTWWFANITRSEPEGAGTTTSEQWLELLRKLHADDPPPVPQILAGQVGGLRAYPIYDLVHVPHWSRGRVVAIGDAVHGTSPSIGQGASLALEDAMVLARCLRDAADYGEAFGLYQRLRQPRAERMVSYAQEVNKYKRISTNPIAVWLRDALVPLFLRKAASDTTKRWIYDCQIEASSAAGKGVCEKLLIRRTSRLMG